MQYTPNSSLKIDRLRNRPQFLWVAKGKRCAMPGLVLQARNPKVEHAGVICAGFTATKKIGNAVTRNRVKRRLRAVASQILPIAGRPGHDYVLVARAATISRPADLLLQDLNEALKRIHRPGANAQKRTSDAAVPANKGKPQ